MYVSDNRCRRSLERDAGGRQLSAEHSHIGNSALRSHGGRQPEPVYRRRKLATAGQGGYCRRANSGLCVHGRGSGQLRQPQDDYSLSNAKRRAADALPVTAGQNNPYIAALAACSTPALPASCRLSSSSSIAPVPRWRAGTACLLSISFSPLSAGPDIGNLTIFDNNLNALAPNYTSQTIALLGAGAVIQQQTINFTAISQTAGGRRFKIFPPRPPPRPARWKASLRLTPADLLDHQPARLRMISSAGTSHH